MPVLNTQISSMVSEVTNLDSVLAEYHNSLGAYLFDPNSNGLPDFRTIVGSLNVDELLIRAQSNSDSNVDAASGAVSSSVFKAKGIIREVGVRSLTKSLIYGMAVSSIASLGEEILGNSGKTISDMTGSNPSQSDGA